MNEEDDTVSNALDGSTSAANGAGLPLPQELLGAMMQGKSITDVLSKVPQNLLKDALRSAGYEFHEITDTPEGGMDPDDEEWEGTEVPTRPGKAAKSDREARPKHDPKIFQKGQTTRAPADFEGGGRKGPKKIGEVTVLDEDYQPEPPPKRRPAQDPRALGAQSGVRRVRKPAQPAPHQAPTEDGSEDNQGMLNEVGIDIGTLLGSIPGLALGITFEGGGRRVRVSAYYPETRDYEALSVSSKRGHVARFGDMLAMVFGEATEHYEKETLQLEDENALDDEDDAEEDDGEEDYDEDDEEYEDDDYEDQD